MDRDSKSSDSDDRDTNFHFGFNDVNFSDRLLRIEIVADSADGRLEQIGCTSDKRKRRRVDVVEKHDALDVDNNCAEEDIIDFDQPDVEETILEKNHGEEELPATEDSSSGYIMCLCLSNYTDFVSLFCFGFGFCFGSKLELIHFVSIMREAANDDSNRLDGLRVLRVVTLHINSLVLAANSPFFYKLFSNGMIESEQRHATLRISASEEAALMELLNFMYSGKLNVGAASALLEVLIAADKFEVASCTKLCSRLLSDIPMTPEFALLCLDLPSSVLIADAVLPFIDAAKQSLAAKYKDIEKYRSEVMNLPLAAIEAILSSDNLEVASEDAVYDFAMTWVLTHYQNLDEQHNVIRSHLAHCIRFPQMTCFKLKQLLSSNDLDCDFAVKTVLDALSVKAERTHPCLERSYKFRPVKVVELEHPRQRCIIYLHFKREEFFVNMFPTGMTSSQSFRFCGQQFSLCARCWRDSREHLCAGFGLTLKMTGGGSSVTLNVGWEFSFRLKPTEEFSIKNKGDFTFTGESDYYHLFSSPWNDFVREENPYYINDVIFLRAELSLK